MNRRLFFLLLLVSGLYSCRKTPRPAPLVKAADYQKAESLIYKRNDSAFYYFNKFAAVSKDSLQVAMAYNRMAMIQSDAGDYFGCQESLLTSLKYLDEKEQKDRSCLASDYNELGVSNVSLKNYDAAIAYYDLAIKFSETKEYKLIFLNNKALVYQKKKAYPKALKIYRTVLAQVQPDGTEYARVLSNMARTKWLHNPAADAAPELLKALRIRQREKDDWGQNASYAHLSDYYQRKDTDSAFFYAGEMYAVARRLNSPDDRLEALQKLIRSGPVRSAKEYFTAYQRLNDSLQTVRAAAKNQFALIRYDAEKNKADNLTLQKDNTEKKYEITKQYILLVLVLLALIGAVLWYRNAMRASRLRTSKKVHDVVANGLYRMMSEVENREQVDKEHLLDQIEVLYEQSRDISYDRPRLPDQDFPKKMEILISSFSTLDTKVAIVGNDEGFWERISAQVRYELEQVLQELMVNMKKHSRAGDVLVRFEEQGDLRHITYTDDGVGFNGEVRHQNGLTSTGNRIKAIHGKIIFDGEEGKGLRVRISFPIAKTDRYV